MWGWLCEFANGILGFWGTFPESIICIFRHGVACGRDIDITRHSMRIKQNRGADGHSRKRTKEHARAAKADAVKRDKRIERKKNFKQQAGMCKAAKAAMAKRNTTRQEKKKKLLQYELSRQKRHQKQLAATGGPTQKTKSKARTQARDAKKEQGALAGHAYK